jgi:broad specificity phosphatase PhoE
VATLYLVRHGQAAAGFDGHRDPGLSDLGRRQADAAAEALESLGPLALVTSPLARARETARPLEAAWATQATVEPAIAEIPSPTDDLAARSAWLRTIMAGTVGALPPELVGWRSALVDRLLAQERDAVLFTHFVAINLAVGAAEGSDAMVVFRPDNASITVLSNATGHLEVLRRGAEADTEVR